MYETGRFVQGTHTKKGHPCNEGNKIWSGLVTDRDTRFGDAWACFLSKEAADEAEFLLYLSVRGGEWCVGNMMQEYWAVITLGSLFILCI